MMDISNLGPGILIKKSDIELHRKYFKEMTKLLGIQVLYRAPRDSKNWNTYGELDTLYYEPVVVGCIFDEHPTIWTMKKLGWNTEQSESTSIIHVPYDLEKLQVGSLFIIPDTLNPKQGRLFRVSRMSTSFIYPASIACEIAPEYENTFQKSNYEYKHETFNLLNTEEDED